MTIFPRLINPVLDAPDVGELAEFYRRMFGWRYAAGFEPDAPDAEPVPGWLVLADDDGRRVLAFQRVPGLTPTTWPDQDVPTQAHLCFQVDDPDDLDHQAERAQELGATLRLHRTDEPEEPLYVLADPAGHPFCLYSHPKV